MNGFHILKPRIEKTIYRIRLPYQRKFWSDFKTRSLQQAIKTAQFRMTVDKLPFAEVYRIDIDSNPYYESIQTLVCKLWK